MDSLKDRTHLIETPKHLMAIARSKNMAAFGKVNWETAKKDALRCPLTRVAQIDRRYKPNPPIQPDRKHVSSPGNKPDDAMD